jgi:hypothetical protein
LTSKFMTFSGPLTSYLSNMLCIRSHFRRGKIIVTSFDSWSTAANVVVVGRNHSDGMDLTPMGR